MSLYWPSCRTRLVYFDLSSLYLVHFLARCDNLKLSWKPLVSTISLKFLTRKLFSSFWAAWLWVGGNGQSSLNLFCPTCDVCIFTAQGRTRRFFNSKSNGECRIMNRHVWNLFIAFFIFFSVQIGWQGIWVEKTTSLNLHLPQSYPFKLRWGLFIY